MFTAYMVGIMTRPVANVLVTMVSPRADGGGGLDCLLLAVFGLVQAAIRCLLAVQCGRVLLSVRDGLAGLAGSDVWHIAGMVGRGRAAPAQLC